MSTTRMVVSRGDSSEFIVPLLDNDGSSSRLPSRQGLRSSTHIESPKTTKIWSWIEKTRQNLPSASRRVVGLLMLFYVVVSWVASFFIVSSIFSNDSYSKPYLVNYINTASFTLYLIPFAIQNFGSTSGKGRIWKIPYFETNKDGEDSTNYTAVSSSGIDNETHLSSNTEISTSERLSIRETAKVSLEFCLQWFVANYFASACLQFTSVASTTILSCTSAFFTLIVGTVLKVEHFRYIKLIAVLVSLSGVTIIALSDAHHEPHNSQGNNPELSNIKKRTATMILLGDFMALMGALCYAFYTTLLKLRIGHESRISMQLFFGFVGLFNLIGLWPGLIILHFLGWEILELPSTREVYYILGINAFISFTSEIAWVLAMLHTTPLIVTVGLSLSIPLSLIGQIFIQGKRSTWLYWFGAGLVFSAFILLNSSGEEEEEQHDVSDESGEHSITRVP